MDFAGSSPTNVNTTICSGAIFADVNNDKKLDAISSCNGYITVQLGNGDATFQAPAYYAFNGGASALVDLNGDGYLDIAAVQIGTGVRPVAVAVLLNKGSTGPGVFGSPTEYAFPPPASGLDLGNFEGLFAGDFNGDGKQDLLTAFSYQGTATSPTLYPTSSGIDVFFGNGDGTLRQATVQPGPAITSLTVGDFNGDGVTDVAESLTSPTSNSLYGSVQILLGATGGTFTQGASLPIVGTNGGYLSAVSLSDQGPLDLVVNMGTGILTIFQGDGKANFTFAGSYPVLPLYESTLCRLEGGRETGPDCSWPGKHTCLFPWKRRWNVSGPARCAFLRPNRRREQRRHRRHRILSTAKFRGIPRELFCHSTRQRRRHLLDSRPNHHAPFRKLLSVGDGGLQR